MRNFLTGLIFCLFSGTLFLSTSLFVNAQITPKWYFGVFTGLILVLMLIATFFFSGRIRKLQYSSFLSDIFFVITILCLTQAAYGILQYFKILPAVNGLNVTGSFDNPAGFAACLCAGFPFCFYYASQKNKWQRWISLPAVFLIIIAVVLSASRAGIVSLFVTGLFFLFYNVNSISKCNFPILSAKLHLLIEFTYDKIGFQENYIYLIANTNPMVHLLQINAYVE